mgnify:CR=1 FL=1
MSLLSHQGRNIGYDAAMGLTGLTAVLPVGDDLHDPGLELPGRVLRVKPLGEEKLGDVTYTVVVVPEEEDPRLKWRMTAVVTLYLIHISEPTRPD